MSPIKYVRRILLFSPFPPTAPPQALSANSQKFPIAARRRDAREPVEADVCDVRRHPPPAALRQAGRRARLHAARRAQRRRPHELRQRLPPLHEEERVHALRHLRLRHSHAGVPPEGAVSGQVYAADGKYLYIFIEFPLSCDEHLQHIIQDLTDALKCMYLPIE